MGIDARMLIKTKSNPSQQQVLNWARQICDAYSNDKFWIDYEERRHCLTVIDEYTQDGDSIFPEKDETLIKVHLYDRYYGPGYERGDIGFYISLAAYLESLIPRCEIYYGGDSSGVLAVKFDSVARDEMFRHFVKNAGSPYSDSWKDSNQTPICFMCNNPMRCYGTNYFHCPCGLIVNKRDDKWYVQTKNNNPVHFDPILM